MVHSDIIGSFSPSLGGARYILTIIDDFSRYTFVYLLKHRSEAFEKFKKFVTWANNKFSKPISALQCDRGGELLSHSFKRFLAEKGILSSPYTPEQNGLVECKGRSLQEAMMCSLKDAKLSFKFWGKGISTAFIYKIDCIIVQLMIHHFTCSME